MLNPLRFFATCFSVLVLLVSGNVTAQMQGGIASSPEPQRPDDVLAYWTPERIAYAEPMPTPTVIIQAYEAQPVIEPDTYELTDYGVPAVVNGHPPGGDEYIPKEQTFPEAQDLSAEPQAFGSPPTNPLDNAKYGKFQRWTMHGKYTSWPRSLHGKLFFSLNGGNWVCSATAAGRSTIITAGHCVSDGTDTWATNLMFCPSYNQGGANTLFGCWAAGSQVTTTNWHNSGDPDYDYACAVTANTGTVQANKLGNVTGWAGRAWNFGADEPEVTFGYPAGAPFPGNVIQQTASVDWYEWDLGSGGLKSKLIGSDLTGGSSGGGWFLSWRAPGSEVVDTDGSSTTDPAGGNNGPYVNGVNSHKRCLVNCSSPPSAAAGVFWQEMSSPLFWSSSEAANDSEDVFTICLDHPNNDP
jgi:hypothetical protein